jgi:hypothetical protein
LDQFTQDELIGIVEREIRSGYSGFIFLTGIARWSLATLPRAQSPAAATKRA